MHVDVAPLLTARRKVYGYVIYQQRITMIRRRDPGHYGENLCEEPPIVRRCSEMQSNGLSGYAFDRD
jgi:hypothetical protein